MVDDQHGQEGELPFLSVRDDAIVTDLVTYWRGRSCDDPHATLDEFIRQARMYVEEKREKITWYPARQFILSDRVTAIRVSPGGTAPVAYHGAVVRRLGLRHGYLVVELPDGNSYQGPVAEFEVRLTTVDDLPTGAHRC